MLSNLFFFSATLFQVSIYGKRGSVRNALLSTFNVKVCMVWCPLRKSCNVEVGREGSNDIHSSGRFYIVVVGCGVCHSCVHVANVARRGLIGSADRWTYMGSPKCSMWCPVL